MEPENYKSRFVVWRVRGLLGTFKVSLILLWVVEFPGTAPPSVFVVSQTTPGPGFDLFGLNCPETEVVQIYAGCTFRQKRIAITKLQPLQPAL